MSPTIAPIPTPAQAADRKVRLIIATVFRLPVEEITPAQSLTAGLVGDSVAMIELAMALEEEFGAVLTSRAAETMDTVGDVIAWATLHQA